MYGLILNISLQALIKVLVKVIQQDKVLFLTTNTAVALKIKILGDRLNQRPFDVELSPTVLKESKLLGNEMKLHPHYEIPNANSAVLFIYYLKD